MQKTWQRNGEKEKFLAKNSKLYFKIERGITYGRNGKVLMLYKIGMRVIFHEGGWGMGESGIMKFLRTDTELQDMRKKWRELGMEDPFPPFNYDEYNGTSDYKGTISELLDDYEEGNLKTLY